MEVLFYELDTIEDQQLRFAVIISRYQEQWVFVRHHARKTLEIPGGKREQDETIDLCARRELMEETAAEVFELRPLYCYGVKKGTALSYGQVYFAEISCWQATLENEIAERFLLADGEVPAAWTYPAIQPLLFTEAACRI